eukprot:428448-Pleurochrysis_carterae.AAC.1
MRLFLTLSSPQPQRDSRHACACSSPVHASRRAHRLHALCLSHARIQAHDSNTQSLSSTLQCNHTTHARSLMHAHGHARPQGLPRCRRRRRCRMRPSTRALGECRKRCCSWSGDPSGMTNWEDTKIRQEIAQPAVRIGSTCRHVVHLPRPFVILGWEVFTLSSEALTLPNSDFQLSFLCFVQYVPDVCHPADPVYIPLRWPPHFFNTALLCLRLVQRKLAFDLRLNCAPYSHSLENVQAAFETSSPVRTY